ncbi:undecaprenyl-phosphate glucose phosphotransferase [Candidimonas sp. SYP-B2681]|uniref:undecaprenyl-phosphate glucose phosphotransferase n=1 Tax=Candidimonas sp. SYP-B2681 TaxID=2497686 RepID=UPI000F89C1EC|nr:undecaprenyl-phosphate glucose phosphotransferase [Candidimonas sp. SYP-B2681]RTZ43157.1 undecaprenyl-phosphate glucose phosphotransferase [Candidimonas sp. SYP-B2681]
MKPSSPFPPTLAERYPIALLAGVVDLLLIISGSYIAHFLRFGDWYMLDHYLVATLVIALMVAICQVMLGTYLSWRGRHFFRQLARMYGGWLLALAIMAALAVFLKVADNYSRIWLATTLAVAVGLVTIFRMVVFLALRRMRSRGLNLKRVIVVEAGSSAANLRDREAELPEHGYRVVKNLQLVHSQDWLNQLVSDVIVQRVHELWLCLPLHEGEAIKIIMHALRHQTVDIRYLPDLGDLPLLNHRVSDIAGLYALDISRSPMEGPARLIKRSEDLLLGSAISIVVLPICILIALAIKCTSRGPVIFKQYRTGISGRRFKVYKFRSMEVHEEGSNQLTQAHFGDPRITKLGAFLRRSSLDELPQFYNVLQGRMSIVGPRPHALAHNEHYKEIVESYMQRHKVKPGVTGWAQVNGYRGETDTLEKMEKRVEHDLWYIDNWSLGLDLKIIFQTIYKGFFNGQP